MRVPVLLFDVVLVTVAARPVLLTVKTEECARSLLQALMAAKGAGVVHLDEEGSFTVYPRTGVLERADLETVTREGYTLDNAALAAAFTALDAADDATRVVLGFAPRKTPLAPAVEPVAVDPVAAPLLAPEPGA